MPLDVHPTYALADFVRDSQAHAARIRDTKTPETLTMDGEVALVVQDAASYEAMRETVERSELVASLRQSMADGEAGLGVSAAEARRRLREKHGF